MAQSGSSSGNLFVEGGAGTLKLLAYLALAVVLMVADHRGGYLDRVRTSAGLLTGPLYRLAGAPAQLAHTLSDHFTTQRTLLAENDALREQLLLANARMDRLAGVQVENQRLRELLGGTRGLQLNVQLAGLIDIDLDPFRHRLVIDAGSRRGVAEGLAVIDGEGLVGQVLSVTPMNATVYRQFEQETLQRVIEARSRVFAAQQSHSPAALGPAESALRASLGNLFAVAEARPAARLDRGGEVLLVWSAPESSADPVGPPAPAGRMREPAASGENRP